MYILFSIIFILSLAAGWVWSYIHEMTLMGTLICLVVGGFAGSSIIAVIFSYLYFYQKETDKEKIQRLQLEVNEVKQIKRIKQ